MAEGQVDDMKHSVVFAQGEQEAELADKWGIRVVPGGSVTTPVGFVAGGFHCGIKRKRPDLGAIRSAVPATAAGVFTQNRFQGAPLVVTRESLKAEGKLQAVVVNSGIANACTGKKGLEDAYAMRRLAAEVLDVPEPYVAVASTGWIGRPLPMDVVAAGLRRLPHHLGPHNAEAFCQAILTTDTFTKSVCVEMTIDGKRVCLAGAAKGSGMVKPNMATILGFLTTDAAVEREALQRALKRVTDETYNMITIDGDTSTNDMVLILANGLAGNNPLHEGHPEWEKFEQALLYVSRRLSQMIARDGEGATKLIQVHVHGAATKETARAVARTVIGSNLVKSAMFGEDGNWARIIAAVGYCEAPIDPETVDIWVGDVQLVKNSLPVPYDEAALQAHLEQEAVHITIGLNQGHAEATAYGCDLTYEYIRINASYGRV